MSHSATKLVAAVMIACQIMLVAGCEKKRSPLYANKMYCHSEQAVSAVPPEHQRNTESFAALDENPLRRVQDHPLSTFSIDVDTAGYSIVRRMVRDGRLPDAKAVRIEELINYFNYDHTPPAETDDSPFAVHTEMASCPWNKDRRLVSISLKGKEFKTAERPRYNLVFLIDTSGSMRGPDRIGLVKYSLRMLVSQLTEADRVSIVTYAGDASVLLRPTSGDKKAEIRRTIDRLESGGSTHGSAGMDTAYGLAAENYNSEAINRIILCTDGDFNVGRTSEAGLLEMVEKRSKSGVYLTVLGFGMGNLNDSMLEAITNRGNGNYGYVDSRQEARRILSERLNASLQTIAKDVKIQVEFNPTVVQAYRLIGYENRILNKEDFNDDRKDAGDIGAGHTVTALYEIVPVGVELSGPRVDSLRYQKPTSLRTNEAVSRETLIIKLRYKRPNDTESTLMEFPFTDRCRRFQEASGDFKFASTVAGFGLLLRQSPHRGQITWDWVETTAKRACESEYRQEREGFVELVRSTRRLWDRQSTQ